MIRDAERDDWPAVLALNAGSVEMLSPMDEARLAKLASAACYFRVGGDSEVASFLLGFRNGAAYDGEVFAVFGRDNKDFLYIDRVVVDARRRGQGLAGLLYDDIAGFARVLGVRRLVCEAYLTNDVSVHFHAKRGFAVVGQYSLAETGKTVALLERGL